MQKLIEESKQSAGPFGAHASSIAGSHFAFAKAHNQVGKEMRSAAEALGNQMRSAAEALGNALMWSSAIVGVAIVLSTFIGRR